MVVSSANLKIELEGNLATQSSVYKEYCRGLRTQPFGAPVLRIIKEKVLLPILTDCGLWVRKFRIQSEREELKPRPRSLEMSFVGIMVLKAELEESDIGVFVT